MRIVLKKKINKKPEMHKIVMHIILILIFCIQIHERKYNEFCVKKTKPIAYQIERS